MHSKYKYILYAVVGILIGLGIAALYRNYQMQKYIKGQCFYSKINCVKAPCEPIKICPGMSPTPTSRPSK